MAHKTGGGSTRKNRDSVSKRLGVKLFGGQKAEAAKKEISFIPEQAQNREMILRFTL